MITGAPPKAWAMGMPEFLVTDLAESLGFWTGPMGFRIAYSRPEQQFVYLEHPDGAQMMMYPRDGDWEVGPMERPFGRGVVFQVYVTDVDAQRQGRHRRGPALLRRSRANAGATGATVRAASANSSSRTPTATSSWWPRGSASGRCA